MRPYKMTVMRTDMIFIHKLMTIVSMPRPISSPIPIVSIWLLNMVVRVACTSRLVEPDMEDAACVTTWLPTSNTAMTISKVLESSMTAIQALNKKRKNRLVSKSCILFLSITIVISS